jgi:hypothetical protein
MKRVILGALTVALISSAALFADAKTEKKSTAQKLRPKLALMFEGKITKEIEPTKQSDEPGVGTHYTFEWTGGQGDIFISADGGGS